MAEEVSIGVVGREEVEVRQEVGEVLVTVEEADREVVSGVASIPVAEEVGELRGEDFEVTRFMLPTGSAYDSSEPIARYKIQMKMLQRAGRRSE